MAEMDTGSSGGSTDDGGDTDSGGSAGGSTGSGQSTNALNVIPRLQENPEALLVSLMLGTAVTYEKAKRLVADQSVAEVVIGRYIFGSFLEPLAADVYDAGSATLDSIVFILFGSDYKVGVSYGSTWGLVDIPIGIVSRITTFVDRGTTQLVLGITAINEGMAAQVTGLGLAAPSVVAVLWALEISAGVLAMWVVLSSIDVPGIKAVQAIKSVSKPVRNIMERLT